MGPFFGDKIGIIGDHVDKGRLRISGGIENIVKFRKRTGTIGLDNGCCDNEKMNQTTHQDQVFVFVVVFVEYDIYVWVGAILCVCTHHFDVL
jgi:hypothetical protein